MDSPRACDCRVDRRRRPATRRGSTVLAFHFDPPTTSFGSHTRTRKYCCLPVVLASTEPRGFCLSLFRPVDIRRIWAQQKVSVHWCSCLMKGCLQRCRRSQFLSHSRLSVLS